eukprot:1667949-Pyramimonas_sp.AAC.1
MGGGEVCCRYDPHDIEGHDRPWARFLHALGTLPNDTVHVYGVRIVDDDEHAVAEPPRKDMGFGRKRPRDGRAIGGCN